jgi:hypothetical protein
MFREEPGLIVGFVYRSCVERGSTTISPNLFEYRQVASRSENYQRHCKRLYDCHREYCPHFTSLTLEIVASSERSSSSGAAALPKAIKPLLELKLEEIKKVLAALVPEKKKRNVLEEAMFEDDGNGGFESEVLMQGIISQ